MEKYYQFSKQIFDFFTKDLQEHNSEENLPSISVLTTILGYSLLQEVHSEILDEQINIGLN